MFKPLVAIVGDVIEHDSYFWHGTPDTYLRAASEAAGVTPVIVPALGPAVDLGAVLGSVDGVLLSGARSNVHPAHYGASDGGRHGPFDEHRDSISLPLIRRAIDQGLPLLAICRGHQELNVALGGSLASDIQEVDGRDDHRAPGAQTQNERYAVRQKVVVQEGGALSAILGAGETVVNSLHRQAIDRLAEPLFVEAVAPDGTLEAVSMPSAKSFTIGIQWHPEYWAMEDAPSKAIFEAFGDAVRAHAAERTGA